MWDVTFILNSEFIKIDSSSLCSLVFGLKLMVYKIGISKSMLDTRFKSFSLALIALLQSKKLHLINRFLLELSDVKYSSSFV